MPLLGILFWLIGTLIGLAVLLSLIVVWIWVWPRKTVKPSETLVCDYAHRGLHGRGVPENSLAAFELACKAGYGIELDVQLSVDGEVMVFHDYTLVRMTGHGGKVCELTAAELGTLTLGESEETIPTFAQVLELVGGRVPLLVELKGESTDSSLCPKVAKLLEKYEGEYCLESFNPLLIGQMKKLLPEAYRGLLYTDVCREKKKYSALNIALTAMALNIVAKPDFIAYNHEYRNALPVRLSTKGYRAPRFVWTIKTAADRDAAHARGEKTIFEGIFEDQQEKTVF